MDDHFEQMLAPSTAGAYNLQKYIPTAAFEGNKFGFVFKKGAKGLGYYYDHIQKQPTKASVQALYTPLFTLFSLLSSILISHCHMQSCRHMTAVLLLS